MVSKKELFGGIAILTFVIVSTINPNFGYSESSSQSEPITHTLTTLLDTAEQENIEVNSWHTYTREVVDKEASERDVQNWLNEMSRDYPQLDWKEDPNWNEDHGIKRIGKNEDASTGMQERMTLVAYQPSPNSSTYTAYVLVEQEHTNALNENQIGQQIEMIDEAIYPWQTPENTYLRIEGEAKVAEGDSVTDQAEELLNAYDGNHIEQLSESTFASISAHSSNLPKTGLTTNGEDMNLQIAVRQEGRGLGGETNVTIGTPIITTEY
ncbi:YwmB family TATA-box binding protein [Texcoconibacillus texcoconensis]|uniref:Preprotein translocase subunit SecD n=1 Tax=Texcoconibacillus texcoconensis TaxID=1095777 RepID=A0A840QRR9_9BACI|nr:YwmB family TATA-box binding protein [Texcoconibacillus texcoconensis]MBB5174055.1 preprotein translocase subunit SecD [Texcoconibacillus texcoconensis]